MTKLDQEKLWEMVQKHLKEKGFSVSGVYAPLVSPSSDLLASPALGTPALGVGAIIAMILGALTGGTFLGSWLFGKRTVVVNALPQISYRNLIAKQAQGITLGSTFGGLLAGLPYWIGAYVVSKLPKWIAPLERYKKFTNIGALVMAGIGLWQMVNQLLPSPITPQSPVAPDGTVAGEQESVAAPPQITYGTYTTMDEVKEAFAKDPSQGGISARVWVFVEDYNFINDDTMIETHTRLVIGKNLTPIVMRDISFVMEGGIEPVHLLLMVPGTYKAGVYWIRRSTSVATEYEDDDWAEFLNNYQIVQLRFGDVPVPAQITMLHKDMKEYPIEWQTLQAIKKADYQNFPGRVMEL